VPQPAIARFLHPTAVDARYAEARVRVRVRVRV